MDITNLSGKVTIQKSTAEKIWTPKKSMGKKCKRIHLTNAENHKHSVAVKDTFVGLRQVANFFLSKIGLRRFIPLKIKDGAGNEKKILININSISKRIGVSKKELVESSKKGQEKLKSTISENVKKQMLKDEIDNTTIYIKNILLHDPQFEESQKKQILGLLEKLNQNKEGVETEQLKNKQTLINKFKDFVDKNSTNGKLKQAGEGIRKATEEHTQNLVQKFDDSVAKLQEQVDKLT